MKNSNLFLCCTPVALADSPALWKDLTPCQSHQDLTHQDVPCAERDPTLCWAMTAARGTIKEIGGDDKAAGLGDLQGSFTNTATDQGACSTSNWLTSPVAFKAERL